MNTPQGVIYFDGLCMACSAEINHYRKLNGAEKFKFLDITDATFDAKSHGIDPKRVHKFMHVRDPQGQLHEGVDAFRAIWRELPKYNFMYRLSERKTVRTIMEAGYKAFVCIRPYLPRKKSPCSDSPYCEVK